MRNLFLIDYILFTYLIIKEIDVLKLFFQKKLQIKNITDKGTFPLHRVELLQDLSKISFEF